MNPEFPLELAGVLVDITRDAVTLHLQSESGGGSNDVSCYYDAVLTALQLTIQQTALDFADLRDKFACSLRKVLADMMVLQGTDDKSLYKVYPNQQAMYWHLLITLRCSLSRRVTTSSLNSCKPCPALSKAMCPPSEKIALLLASPRLVRLCHSCSLVASGTQWHALT